MYLNNWRYEKRSYNTGFQISVHKPVTSSDIILIKASLRHIQVSRIILLKNQEKMYFDDLYKELYASHRKNSNELSR